MIIQKSNKVLLFAILIVSLFALTTNKSEAQCPAGWSFQNFVLTINGCQYSVNICYKCAPIALDATEFDILPQITPLDSNCSQTWNESQIINNAYAQIRQRIYLSQLCEIRPCNSPPKSKMKFVQYSCWEYFRDSDGNLHLQACTSSGKCEVEYEVCFDGTSIIWTITDSNWIDTPTCSYGALIIPNVHNTSGGCKRLMTPCEGPF